MIVVRRLKAVRFHEKAKKHLARDSPTLTKFMYVHGHFARENLNA